jgi:hypothetical protein
LTIVGLVSFGYVVIVYKNADLSAIKPAVRLHPFSRGVFESYQHIKFRKG